MDDAQEREDSGGGDQGQRAQAELALRSPDDHTPHPSSQIDPSGDIELRLQLFGHGNLSVETVRMLKHVVAERSNSSGYGFVFEYIDGELNLGLEKSTLPAGCLRPDPARAYESDLRQLIGALPDSFQYDMKAAITLETVAGKVRYTFKAKNGRFRKRVTISSVDATGCGSDDHRVWWANPWLNLGVIAAGILLLLLCHHLKLITLK